VKTNWADFDPKGNILIDASGNPLICDFGLVCILDAEQPDRAADNTTTVHNGTVRYLAYELVQDPPEPRTMASDIHALGCVTYEVCVCGFVNSIYIY
jgi:serine/threonine protein kinase